MNRLLTTLLLLGFLAAARAQIEVGLDLKRNMFIRGEPIEATIIIRNLAGRDIILRDDDNTQWFGFEITKGSDTPVGPYQANYRNDPLVILTGDTVRRAIDLLRLYPLNEYGTYKVRAAIWFAPTGKYITSDWQRVDISEGRKLVSRTVGVPAGKDGAGGFRKMSVLSFQLPKEMTLYARVEDDGTGAILGTYPLGRMIGGTAPGTEFDPSNTLHVFHLGAPGQYFLSKIGVNGEWLGQTAWNSAKGRAEVRRKADGRLVVVGATRTNDAPQAGPPIPKLSDRPMALPK